VDDRGVGGRVSVTSIPIMANYFIGGGNHNLAVSG
jgi:hypothetical protein